MNIGKFSLSTILVFLSITSLGNVTAQPNAFEQCLYNYRRQTVKLRGQVIEKTPWYKDRRVGFDDWRGDPNFYSFTVRKDHHVKNLEDRGADIRYYTNGIYYTIALEPTIEVPKYSEAEMSRRCQ